MREVFSFFSGTPHRPAVSRTCNLRKMKTSRALQTTVYFIVASWTETQVYPHGTEQKWQPLAWLSFRNEVRQPHTHKTHATHMMSVGTTTKKVSSHIPGSARYVSRVPKGQQNIKKYQPHQNKSPEKITRSKRHHATRCWIVLPVGLTLVLHSFLFAARPSCTERR